MDPLRLMIRLNQQLCGLYNNCFQPFRNVFTNLVRFKSHPCATRYQKTLTFSFGTYVFPFARAPAWPNDVLCAYLALSTCAAGMCSYLFPEKLVSTCTCHLWIRAIFQQQEAMSRGFSIVVAKLVFEQYESPQERERPFTLITLHGIHPSSMRIHYCDYVRNKSSCRQKLRL